MDHSSNYLVRFVNAVLETSSWFTNKPVRFSTHAICLLSGEDVASVAEALLARALCSYYFSAGFNIQACGASAHNIYGTNKSPVEKEQKWVECRMWLDLQTDYAKNLVKETERRRALQKRDWKEESEELLRKVNEGEEWRRKLLERREAVHKKINWEVLREDPFFAKYIEMYNGLGDLIG